MTPLQEMHATKGRKITGLAWMLEVVVILTALFLGATIFLSDAAEDVNSSAKAIAIFPLLAAAAIELAKVPLAAAVVFARWYLKPVAAVLLVGVAFSTFETLFQGFEYGANIRIGKVTEAQTELQMLESQRASTNSQIDRKNRSTSLENARISEQIVFLDNQNELFREEIRAIVTGANDPQAIALSKARDAAAAEVQAIRQERLSAIAAAGDEWQSTSDQYRDRIKNGGLDGVYAFELQKRLPSKDRVMREAGQSWDEENEDRIERATRELDEINSELKSYLMHSGVVDQSRIADLQDRITENAERIATLNREASRLSFLGTDQKSGEEIVELDNKILEASTEVSLLAEASNVYRFAGIMFGKRVSDVSAAEARKAAALFWGTLAAVLALGTSGLAMIGAHHTLLSMDKRTPNERRLIRTRWMRKQTVEVVREIPTTKFVWYPTAEAVKAIPSAISDNPFREGERNAA